MRNASPERQGHLWVMQGTYCHAYAPQQRRSCCTLRFCGLTHVNQDMAESMGHVVNVNVGVLGHIDSGKTSLCKALSTVASTAAFDKNPQSKERGITIDLGFSSFTVDAPPHLRQGRGENQAAKVLFTLVDCPGHASLIRTIIGGAQILDIMLLVVDVTKGVQTQTAECIVIGEITCQKMIVVLNKVDLLPLEKQKASIEKMVKRMKLTLQNTCFSDAPIVSVAAHPGGSEDENLHPQGVQELVSTLCSYVSCPVRNPDGPFVFAVDHCFSIRGQGTVMTGTALYGSISVNDMIEIPTLKQSKKIKSMQMFRNPVNRIIQGDRAGICVTQFDSKQLERGLACTPGYLQPYYACIISAVCIPYYKHAILTKAKFHVTISHETVMAQATFFGLDENGQGDLNGMTFDYSREFKYLPHLHDSKKKEQEEGIEVPQVQYALLEFEHVVVAFPNCIVIGSKLDTDIHANTCRLAFHGRLLEGFTKKNYRETCLPMVRVFRDKQKEGIVERAQNENEVIVKSMFRKETNMQVFMGLRVSLSTGEDGVIEGTFGQSGKIKVVVRGGLQEDTWKQLQGGKKGKAAPNPMETGEPIKAILKFRRFVFDPKKGIHQSAQ